VLSLAGEGGFAQQWGEFRRRLDWHGERLIEELKACWREQRAILEDQFRALGEMPVPTVEHQRLALFRDAREQAGRTLLRDPIAKWEQVRPQQRALSAIETYHNNLEDLVLQLPETVSRPDAIAAAGRRLSLLPWRRSVPVRKLVSARLKRAARHQEPIEERWLLALLLSIRMMVRPWEIYRRTIDSLARGKPLGRFQETRQWLEARTEFDRILHDGDAALSALGLYLSAAGSRLFPSLRFPAAARGRSATTPSRRVEALRAIESELRLPAAVNVSAVEVLTTLASALDDIRVEHDRLIADSGAVIEWLQARQQGRTESPFPQAATVVSPAPVRLAQLETRLEESIGRLPEEVAIPPRRRSYLLRRPRTRKLQPRQAARRALARNLRPELERDFDLVQSHHRKAILAMERVREVVAFAESDEAAEAGALTRDAIQHSLSLLEFSRGELASWQPDFELRQVRAAAEAFAEIHLLLGRDWLSVQAYVADRGFRHLASLTGQLATETLSRFARRGIAWSTAAGRRFLRRIGWSVSADAGHVEVVTRAVLPRQFAVDVSTIALPALYRRLFRPEPVQDSRFLVGRERELAAVAEAREFWEQGRPAALLVVGERGTGKTSLVNCAEQQCLKGVEIVREEFTRRVVTAAELRSFLAARLGVDEPDLLEEHLARRRCVIVLEEAERTFLRHIGHYGAARALQRLIAATCSSVLWIVVMNSSAFKLLDAAFEFGSGFSHRVNTGAASRDDIRNAILLRHNLSGLRLEFMAEPLQGGHLKKLAAAIQGGDRSPEALFFNALRRESEGVYRTAFDIWLAHIGSIEAGALYMRPLSRPDLGQVISEFDQEDLFTLAAVLQHGSLTPEEHATVFQLSLTESRARIDQLAAREILDEDRRRGGFRVRPHAIRVVREALYRRNLL